MQNDKWFQSSTGSGDLALRIKAALLLLLPLSLALSQSFGWQWSETMLNNWVILITGSISGFMLLWGIIRSVVK